VGVSWDKGRGVYRSARGREIPYTQVRAAVDAVADDTKRRLRELAQRHVDGRMTFPAWATESEELIRKSLVSSGQIASGGRGQMTPSLNGRIGARLRFHLDKFREFGLARERGEVSDAEMVARSGQYADSIVGFYEQMRQGVMIDAGYTEARNVPGASEKPCSDCPKLTAKGWMPMREFTPIGMRACKSADKCGAEYR
jgi:hypothetical protein